MRVLLLALVVIAGCRKEPRTDAPPVQNTRDAPAATVPADAQQPADACVAECVRQNQMRATSPEQIERDCRAECTGTPP
jgi:hypothetical protein